MCKSALKDELKNCKQHRKVHTYVGSIGRYFSQFSLEEFEIVLAHRNRAHFSNIINFVVIIPLRNEIPTEI